MPGDGTRGDLPARRTGNGAMIPRVLRLGRPVSATVRRGVAWALDYRYIVRKQARAAWRAALPARFSGGERVPVVLIPGIYETWHFLEPYARMLEAAGHPIVVVPALKRNDSALGAAAERVVEAIDRAGVSRCVIVAHSKGGLIGKTVMSLPAAGDRVAGMVAINTPFGGSSYASYIPVRAIRELARNDPALLALATHTDINRRVVSIFASFDPHIPGGSALPGAVNVQVADMGHFRIVESAEVMRLTALFVAHFENRSDDFLTRH